MSQIETLVNPVVPGLCDFGLGEPELGYVSLHELAAVRGSGADARVSAGCFVQDSFEMPRKMTLIGEANRVRRGD